MDQTSSWDPEVAVNRPKAGEFKILGATGQTKNRKGHKVKSGILEGSGCNVRLYCGGDAGKKSLEQLNQDVPSYF